MLLNEFDGQTDRAGEDVVKRAVESLLDFVFAAVVGDGDFHEEENVARQADLGNTECRVFSRTEAENQVASLQTTNSKSAHEGLTDEDCRPPETKATTHLLQTSQKAASRRSIPERPLAHVIVPNLVLNFGAEP